MVNFSIQDISKFITNVQNKLTTNQVIGDAFVSVVELNKTLPLKEDRVDFYDNGVDWDNLPKYIKHRMDKHKRRLCTQNYDKPNGFEEFKERLEIDIDYEVDKYNEMVKSVVKCLKNCTKTGKYTRQPHEINELSKEILNKMDFSILDSNYSELDGLYRRNSYEVECVAKELGYVKNIYFK